MLELTCNPLPRLASITLEGHIQAAKGEEKSLVLPGFNVYELKQ